MNKKHFKEQVVFYQDEDINEVEEFMVNSNVVYELWSNEGDYEKEIRVHLETLHIKVFEKLKERYPEIEQDGYLIVYE